MHQGMGQKQGHLRQHERLFRGYFLGNTGGQNLPAFPKVQSQQDPRAFFSDLRHLAMGHDSH